MSTVELERLERRRALTGIVASLVTPFEEGGRLSAEGFRAQTQRITSAGISNFCIAGGTGEYHSLSVDEYERLIDMARSKHEDATIVAGAFEMESQAVVERLKVAEARGADFGLVIAPPFMNLDESQLVSHWRQVLDSSPLPLILFETPTRSRSTLSTQSLFDLFEEYPAFVGVKDSYGDLGRLDTLIHGSPEGFIVLQGKDDLLFTSYCLGAKGSLNSFGALAPQTCASLLHHIAIGELEQARRLHRTIVAWSKAVYRWTSPVGVKAVMHLNDLSAAIVRSPLSPLTADESSSLQAVAAEIREFEQELAVQASSGSGISR